jgi:hypothetical protein
MECNEDDDAHDSMQIGVLGTALSMAGREESNGDVRECFCEGKRERVCDGMCEEQEIGVEAGSS